MRTVLLTAVACIGLAACSSVEVHSTDAATSEAAVRLGAYDSRALAMAYYRSADFEQQMAGLRDRHAQATAAGDDERAAELESEAVAQQELMHRQGFGTWPVDDILETVRERIPEVAQQAGVDVIVSRWEVDYRHTGVPVTDVTDLLVRLFDPDAQTLEVVEEIKRQDPVPVEELERHD